METSCFGKCYSIEARECRLCDVREECKSVMESAKKMPCYGEYNEESYACIRACHLGGSPDESKCAAVALGLVEPESELQPMEVQTMEERTDETVAEATVEPEPAAVEPEAAAEPAPVGAKNKKDVIRNALRDAPPDGITADAIVQMIIESGFIKGAVTPEVKDKTRHYVIMSISHMRKAGQQVELKEGKYVLTGGQSPVS